MIHHTFLHDHGFETLECHEPPDFNRWILRRALDAVERGVHDPILEEAISVADRIRLPCTEEPFPAEELMNPKVRVGPAQVSSVLRQAKRLCPRSPDEALRLAKRARICAASLGCSQEIRSGLVGLSFAIEANALRVQNRLCAASEALDRSGSLVAEGNGALEASAYLLSIRSSLGYDRWEYRAAEVGARLAYLLYYRAAYVREAGEQLWNTSRVLKDVGEFSRSLDAFETSLRLLPSCTPLSSHIPFTRASILSGLGARDAALFELRSGFIGAVEGARSRACMFYTSGVVERDSGNLNRGRRCLSWASRIFVEEQDWGGVADIASEAAVLEKAAGRWGAVEENVNKLGDLVRCHGFPQKLLLDLEEELRLKEA